MLYEENVPDTACVTCGSPLHGNYCSQCGEKVLHAKDKKVSHFFGEFLHVMTHADGKYLKSLKLIFFKPGLLAKEYIAGRKKPYTAPLTMFIIANLFYFLLPMVDTLNSNYHSQLYGQPYSESIAPRVAQKMEQRKWTEKEMEEHYNGKTKSTSKLLLIVFVFMFSLPVCLLFYNRRFYYVDHLTFATEYVSFVLYGLLLFLPIVLTAIWLLFDLVFHIRIPYDINSDASIIAVLLLLWLYLSLAARRVYSNSLLTVGKTLLLTLSLIPIMFLYRFLLFYVTMMLI